MLQAGPHPEDIDRRRILSLVSGANDHGSAFFVLCVSVFVLFFVFIFSRGRVFVETKGVIILSLCRFLAVC